ncbi:conjugative transposon protein TraN, partial [Bacteroides clarus]
SYVRVGGQAPEPHTLPVGKDKQTFLIFPAGVTYVDYGSTNVEVEKAEGVDNILAVKATGAFTEDTNISAVVEGGKFYTFGLHYVPVPERSSFVIDKEATQKVAILDEKERSSGQKERIREAIAKRTPLDLGLKDRNAGVEFEVGNIFIDGDILLLRMTLTNRTQIGYTTDFMRFYIQDAKIRKKTAVQQVEQNILFTFDYPEEVPAHESRTFTVAMNKFTIPDKKRLVIEIQEKNGGRHFLYKLRNKSLLAAEEVFRSLKEQRTEDEADRILRRISR